MHDLHVWALKPGVTLLAVHLNLQAGTDQHIVLQDATVYCRCALHLALIDHMHDSASICGGMKGTGGQGEQLFLVWL